MMARNIENDAVFIIKWHVYFITKTLIFNMVGAAIEDCHA